MTASVNPRQYTADDRIRWDRYAEQFRAFLNGTAPFPGDPPEGYREVYRVSQRFAPLPEEYSSRVLEARNASRATTRPSTGGVQGSGGAVVPTPATGVTMTGDAFATFLDHSTAMQQQFLGYLKDARAGHGPRPVPPRYGRGRSRGAPRGGLGGRIGQPGRGPYGGGRPENARTRRRQRRQGRAQHPEGTEEGIASQASGSGSTSNSQAASQGNNSYENEDVPADHDDIDLSMTDDFDDEDASRF
ncbi:uncharacterized protein B0H18DRAFT_960611 [Fomitopsis serialis]|uniref:uncharacterized protein n=1 Tax=Fomitopsis serialis TaxID=139415 RepID=UPI002007FDFD|nr:uncharacterized protein B0H18DRAFT_960611 [Neoantrodia serialis]KAH9913099.1 hypothetical protein B0H18DRAFT_960611 [Neoantrodia serialis]